MSEGPLYTPKPGTALGTFILRVKKKKKRLIVSESQEDEEDDERRRCKPGPSRVVSFN